MRRALLLLALPMLLFLAGCGEDGPTGPAPIVIPGPGEAIVYSRHIAPIFANTCGTSGCHLNGSDSGGLTLDTWQSVMAGSTDGISEVIPFSARKSHLFQHLNNDSLLAPIATPSMPLGRDRLPLEQILTIKRWIDEGARNDAGEVAFAGITRSRIFIASRAENLIGTIDETTARIARYLDAHADGVDGNATPDEPVVSPDGYLYVALEGADAVARYNARTLERAGQVAVGPSPAQIAVSADGATLYVAHHNEEEEAQTVTVIDARSMHVARVIDSVGRAPHGLVLSADGRTLYTLNTQGDDIGVVDLASGRVLERIPVSFHNPLIPGFIAHYEPYAGVLARDGRTLWVTCRRSGEVRIIDLAAHSVADSIFVGVRPLTPALTPDGARLWVPNESTNSISVIDIATRRLVNSIMGITEGPNAVAFSTDGRTAYVTSASLADNHRHGISTEPGGLYVIDAGSGATLKKIEIASGASGIAVTW